MRCEFQQIHKAWSRQLLRKRFRERAFYIAGMFGRHRLDQYNPAFLFRDRIMQNAAGHNVHRSFVQMDRSLAFVFDPQIPSNDIEQFVFARVAVPDQFAPNLGNFHVLVIYLRYDLGRPILGDGVERGL
jgi:hypothetical protein